VNRDNVELPSHADASTIPRLARTVLANFRRILVPLILFDVAFKALVGPLWLFGTVWVLPALVAQAGRGAVTNTDLAAFLLTPTGFGVALIAGLALIWVFLFEHVGVMLIAAMSARRQPITVSRVALVLTAAAWRVLHIGAVGYAALAAVCAPFVLLAAVAYVVLFSSYDINYYWYDRPASYYLGIGIGALLLAGVAVAGFMLYVRWVFALPILFLERARAGVALKESWQRIRGAVGRIAAVLLGWQALGFVLSAAVLAGFRWFSALVLDAAGYRVAVVIPLVVLLLAGHGLLLAMLSFVTAAIQSLLILQLYAERGGAGSLTPVAVGDSNGGSEPVITELSQPQRLRLWLVIAAVFGGFLVAVAFGTAGRTKTGPLVEITAHRGDARRHPENTLSAIQGAIDAGADYAEIDVHETADGAIVLLHDDDLMRVAGDPRKVWDLTLAEIRQVDVGQHFSLAHAGERIPTLEQAIALARGKIKLNIELKFRGRERRLAGSVARLIQREQFESQCVVASLTYDGLAEAKRHNPRLRTAAIVTFAVGDINRLKSDDLSVSRSFLSDRLLRTARAQGKQVYVWTVSDPRAMVDFIERGVSNIITHEPRLLAEIRRERQGLTEVQRRLLAVRSFLDIDH